MILVMTMDLTQRKATRLQEYDYSQKGYYFVTICAKDQQKLFGEIVGDGVYDIPQVKLSGIGEIVNKYIRQLDTQYNNVCIDKYIVMPNHIHLIVKISTAQKDGNTLCGTSQAPSPTNAILPRFISLYKRYCNREYGENLFQRSFHDHIIRNEADYQRIWNYIDTNPTKWKEDCFYIAD